MSHSKRHLPPDSDLPAPRRWQTQWQPIASSRRAAKHPHDAGARTLPAPRSPAANPPLFVRNAGEEHRDETSDAAGRVRYGKQRKTDRLRAEGFDSSDEGWQSSERRTNAAQASAELSP